jgi:hypothetical protein
MLLSHKGARSKCACNYISSIQKHGTILKNKMAAMYSNMPMCHGRFFIFFFQVFIFPRDLSPLKIFPSVYLPQRSKLLQLNTVLDKMGALGVNGNISGQAFNMTLPDPSRVISGQD